MEHKHELLAMIMLHQSVDDKIEIDSLYNRYTSFYDKSLSECQIEDSIIELKSEELISKGDNPITLTDKGMTEGNKKYIEYYFSEGVVRAEKSATDKIYQDSKNRGIVNTDSILDDVQLAYITDQLFGLKGTIYDLGCGRGDVITHIQREMKSSCMGVDKSESMIEISKAKNREISWIVANIEKYVDKMKNYDAALLIDSMYFIKDKKNFIKKLVSKLNPGGKIVITFSAYTEDPEKKGTLDPEDNSLGKIFNDLKLDYEYREFTQNEITLWEHRKSITETLKDKYFEENNSFLYYDRMSEASNLLNVLKQDLGRRYIYTVTR